MTVTAPHSAVDERALLDERRDPMQTARAVLLARRDRLQGAAEEPFLDSGDLP